jgi:ABC-type sugar transport system permease subunit
MMQRKFLVGGMAILLAFAIGLVGFFLISDGKPDGLETILDQQGVEETAPVWTAPLGYGTDYASALMMGIIGFSLVLLVSFAYLKFVAKRKQQGTK